MKKYRTTFELDAELMAKFSAINSALGLSNTDIYNKMITEYVAKHYQDYLELASAQKKAQELKEKITGSK